MKRENSTNIEDPKLCSACGGYCCKKAPGVALPEDFGKNPRVQLRRALAGGEWVANSYIDWNPDAEQYFMQPATKTGVFGEGECIFLSDKGCFLPLGRRPFACRTMVPKADCKCEGYDFPKYRAAELWAPYNYLIRKLLDDMTVTLRFLHCSSEQDELVFNIVTTELRYRWREARHREGAKEIDVLKVGKLKSAKNSRLIEEVIEALRGHCLYFVAGISTDTGRMIKFELQ